MWDFVLFVCACCKTVCLLQGCAYEILGVLVKDVDSDSVGLGWGLKPSAFSEAQSAP